MINACGYSLIPTPRPLPHRQTRETQDVVCLSSPVGPTIEEGAYLYTTQPATRELPPLLQISLAHMNCKGIEDIIGEPDSQMVSLSFKPTTEHEKQSVEVVASYRDPAGAVLEQEVTLTRRGNLEPQVTRVISMETVGEAQLANLSSTSRELFKKVGVDPAGLSLWLAGPNQTEEFAWQTLTTQVREQGSRSSLSARAEATSIDGTNQRRTLKVSCEKNKQPSVIESARVKLARGADLKSAAPIFETVKRLSGIEPKRFFDEVFDGLAVRPDDVQVSCDQDEGGSNARIDFHLMNEKGRAGEMCRSFRRPRAAEPLVHHDYFRLIPESQGADLAKEILGRSIPYYESVGFSKIGVFACLNVGGYAWAKYGFLPKDQEEMEYLAAAIERKLDRMPVGPEARTVLSRLLKNKDPRALWTLSDLAMPIKKDGEDTTLGKALLLGQGWEGILDLGDREARQRFDSYVGRKSMKEKS